MRSLIAVVGESTISHPDAAALAEDVAGANPHLDVAIPIGAGQMRNVIIVLAAKAVIAIGGGAGTLSEIGHALRAGRRVVGLRTWELTIAGQLSGMLVAKTADEAVRMAVGREGE